VSGFSAIADAFSEAAGDLFDAVATDLCEIVPVTETFDARRQLHRGEGDTADGGPFPCTIDITRGREVEIERGGRIVRVTVFPVTLPAVYRGLPVPLTAKNKLLIKGRNGLPDRSMEIKSLGHASGV